MKKLLGATLLALSLTGCNQAPQQPAAPPADLPLAGDSTLLDQKDTVVQLADSVPHLNQPQ